MKLIEEEGVNFEFLIETLDDMWVLSQFVDLNDRVFGRAERKVKIGNETNYKVVKKLIFVELLVKQVKFENEVLRVTGEIQNETEFSAVGVSQTLTYNLGDKIKLQKQTVLEYQKKMIDNAIKSKNSYNLVVLLDKDDMVVFEYSSFSYKVLFEKSGLGSKKYKSLEIDENEEKYELIKDILKRDYASIIFAGPSLFKDKLQKYVGDKLGIKILTIKWNEVSSGSISNLIREINESSLVFNSQISHENKYLSKLLENINKGKKYVYGRENTYESVNAGRCEVLLVSTKFIDSLREDSNSYAELNEIMKTAERLNCELVIVDSKNQSGKVLDGLGGIGGVLRY
jgi:stalled ribosome rescue protein Dom34